MNKESLTESDYTYPDSPIYCLNNNQKCHDSNCNEEFNNKSIAKCVNCQIWRWRFVQNNSLVVGDWFMSAAEADNAKQKEIERTVEKEMNKTMINNSHSDMVYKFQRMKKRISLSQGVKQKSRRKIDSYYKPGTITCHKDTKSQISTNSSSSTYSKCSESRNITPDTNKKNKKNLVTNLQKKTNTCPYCRKDISNGCHNSKYGLYLYQLCMKLYKDNKKSGVKHEIESYDLIFRQRYHILAEFDAYNEYGILELEYDNLKKRELTECLKEGYYHRMKNTILNNIHPCFTTKNLKNP